MELSRLIRERFDLKAEVPRWREKRILFAPEERIITEEEKGELASPEETFHNLFRHLERNYKRLRKKLRRKRSKGKEAHDPRWLEKLEEVNRKMEELESESD